MNMIPTHVGKDGQEREIPHATSSGRVSKNLDVRIGGRASIYAENGKPRSTKRPRDIVDLTEDDSDLDGARPRSPLLKRSRSSSDGSTGSANPLRDIQDSQSFDVSAVKAKQGRPKNGIPTSQIDRFAGKGRRVVAALPGPKKPRTPAEISKRQQFERNLASLSGVSVINDIDHDSPDIDFKFIRNNVLATGVYRAPDDVMIGCDCQQRYKQQFGCVYLTCSCIQDAPVGQNQKKSFPYGASENNYRCLRPKILNTRNHIYECNSRCDCTMQCKNRVVQHGRHVNVQIFKTANRGWGLRCLEDLQQGQFIDTYRGEIITSEEADRRGKQMTEDEANFLFDFDKFKDAVGVYDPERAYVCDGRYMGSPARFLNHSCDPNCRLFTVSYNHNDRNIYELAFFALQDIPRSTELTFDYYDEEDPVIISDEMAKDFEAEKGYRPTRCLCENQNCRRYFFH